VLGGVKIPSLAISTAARHAARSLRSDPTLVDRESMLAERCAMGGGERLGPRSLVRSVFHSAGRRALRRKIVTPVLAVEHLQQSRSLFAWRHRRDRVTSFVIVTSAGGDALSVSQMSWWTVWKPTPRVRSPPCSATIEFA